MSKKNTHTYTLTHYKSLTLRSRYICGVPLDSPGGREGHWVQCLPSIAQMWSLRVGMCVCVRENGEWCLPPSTCVRVAPKSDILIESDEVYQNIWLSSTCRWFWQCARPIQAKTQISFFSLSHAHHNSLTIYHMYLKIVCCPHLMGVMTWVGRPSLSVS